MPKRHLNWYQIGAYALTVIRFKWPVEKLERMAREGYDTPVSGSALARAKKDLPKPRR